MHFKALTLFCVALLSQTHASRALASPLPEDSSAATIYTYFSISDQDEDANLSPDSFTALIEEIATGGYNVISLPALLQGQKDKRSLPRKTVALTFDKVDDSFLKIALPRLIERKLPFTVFISPGQLDDPAVAVTWDDLRSLQESGLATIGLTSYKYGHIAGWTKDRLTADINQAKARYREELKTDAKFFAYPFGEYSPAYRDVVANQGFVAAFSQTSGVAYHGADVFALPRFTVTEEFGDLDRLRMTSQALPFPVKDIVPSSMIIADNPPFPGFTVTDAISAADLKAMTCFASGMGKLSISLLGKNRVEIRLPEKFDEDKGRVNCTLPVKSADDASDVRWRWLGFMYSIPANLVETEPQQPDGGDFANPEQP